jgi:tRNA dimethylallyltransferase
MGPTAAGKTALAEAIFQCMPVEIVSVDSALVYRGMDIGTAKPSARELRDMPHHLIDIKDPMESFSVGEFCQQATVLAKDILAKGKVPLFVGGTMLYFNALVHGVSVLPPSSEEMRSEIEAEAQKVGWGMMHQQLQAFDPEAFARINPNDTQRIQRAIEVYRLTGKSISELQSQVVNQFPCSPITVIIEARDRAVLHARIQQRLENMFAAGFIKEVEGLYHRGDLTANMPSMRSVGYRQAWQYLAGEMEYSELFDKVLFATRQLAKRQITWLRRWQNAKRFYIEDEGVKTHVINYINAELAS